MKKITSLTVKICSAAIVASIMLSLGSCGQNEESHDRIQTVKTAATTTTQPITERYSQNPLTGKYDLDKNFKNMRPVAVMVNNIEVAQEVQVGLGKADMVFETVVEGGITRLMAVYSNIGKMGPIGSVRSSRYTFAELAKGLDAVYVHCGSDNKYCTPLMKSLNMDDWDMNTNNNLYGKRVKNGLAYEHTLYAYGEKLYSLYNKRDQRRDIDKSAIGAYKFNDEKDVKKYDTAAKNISVNTSESYKTKFVYDDKEKKYIRCDKNGQKMMDFRETTLEQFTNVFVLFTDTYALSDGYHMRSQLDGGSGYYITAGTKTDITWKKGEASNPLKFYDESGKNQLSMNCGNSYIMIVDEDLKGKCDISA